jgi:hypothetical protein
MAQVEKRLASLEKQLGTLRQSLEHQQAVEGIRRGLESADRGEGIPIDRAFRHLRRKYGSRSRQ